MVARKHALSVGAIIAIAVIMVLYFTVLAPIEEEFNIYITVGEFFSSRSSEGNNIDFGGVNPTGISVQYLYITPEDDFVITVLLDGEMAPWVGVSENNFEIKAGETKKLRVSVIVPEGTKNGVYTGKLILKHKPVII